MRLPFQLSAPACCAGEAGAAATPTTPAPCRLAGQGHSEAPSGAPLTDKLMLRQQRQHFTCPCTALLNPGRLMEVLCVDVHSLTLRHSKGFLTFTLPHSSELSA